MNVYLPIAEMSVNGALLLMLGLGTGFLSGLFGVGGGFILTPLLVLIGVPPNIAVGTQACQLAGTTLSGALAHWRRRQIDIRMGLVITTGAFAGTFAGVELFKWLQQTGYINFTITFGYMLLLGITGGIMMIESWGTLRHKPSMLGAARTSGAVIKAPWGAGGPFKMTFPASRLRISILAPMLIGFGCGILVAIFGVGGGFILVPAMLYLLRMPVNLVNGTALFKVIFTTAFTAILQAIVTHSVDAVLAFFLLLGSVGGAQWGARYAQRLRPEVARFLLASLILAVAAVLLSGLVITPHSFFSMEMKY